MANTFTITLNAPELGELAKALVDLAAALGHKAVENIIPASLPEAAPAVIAPAIQVPTQTAPIIPTQAPQAYPAPFVPQSYAPPTQAPYTPAPVPVTAPTYNLDQLSSAGSALVDAGKIPEVRALVQSFQIDALTKLPKDQYGAFAAGLRALGAKI